MTYICSSLFRGVWWSCRDAGVCKCPPVSGSLCTSESVNPLTDRKKQLKEAETMYIVLKYDAWY